MIYLVSACGSGEEFVAAFRRYADRSGLFIPMAEPIAAGRRGRFALALKDGGVMIEGEAEVVSSSRTPSVIHGRVGMTVRFVELDEPSKTVLVELEKARLAMRPPPPSVPPRPAEIPAEPRAVPPAPAGRIDRTNALAECVAIGDVEALEVVPKSASPPKAGPKFVVPSIPPVAGARPKALSPPFGARAIEPKPAPEQVPAAGAVVAGVTAPIEGADPEAELTAQQPPPIAPEDGARLTERAIPAQQEEPPAAPTPAPAPEPAIAPAPAPALASMLAPESLVPRPPVVAEPIAVLDVEVSSEPTDLTTIPHEPEDLEEAPVHALASLALPPALAATAPSPVPPAPPASPAPAVARPPIIEEGTPSGDWTMKPGADGPTIERRGPPKITPAGDWLIALDPKSDDGWSEPAKLDGAAAAAAAAPAAPARPPATPPRPAAPPPRRKDPMVAIVASTRPLESEPQRPPADHLGFSEPKVQVDPTLIEPLVAMPPLDAPAGPEAPRNGEPPVGPSGSQPMPMIEPAMAASSSSGIRLQQMLTPVPGFPSPYTLPPAGTPPLGPGPAYPMEPGQADPPRRPSAPADATFVVRRAGAEGRAPTANTGGRRRRMLVIAASAGLVLALGVVLAVVLAGGEASPPAGAATAPAPVRAAAPDAAPAVAVPDAAAIAPTPAPADTAATAPAAPADTAAPAAPADTAATAGAATAVAPAPADGACTFEVTSTPPGAEVLGATDVIATTPAQLTFPCDVEVKLTFKKARYLTTERKFTPTAKNKVLKVALAKPTFLVKVTSKPAGAMISVGGRTQGVTPTTVKLPAYETSTLVISKEGYATDTQKITAKQNNQAVTVELRRTPRKVFR